MVPFKTTSLNVSANATIGTTLSAKGIVYALAGDSSQWNSTFTTVRTNSASWEESADILPTVTNYLSTSNVQILSLSTASLVVSGVGTPFILKNSGGSNSVFFEPASNGNAGSLFGNYIYSSNVGSRGDDNLTINYGGGGTRSVFFSKGGTTRATLLSNGHFGLGLVAPTPNERLTVSGNISATGTVFASAANISGDIVANRIQATVKNFYIKHPTKPDKHLVYSSLESPYNGVQLTGEDEVVNGLCVVELPDYLNNLVHSDSVHIQLTNYQHSKSLHVEGINIDQNNFTVKCDSWFSKSQKLKFFWLLNGVRKDIERLETEV
jgi:hypothetical protein